MGGRTGWLLAGVVCIGAVLAYASFSRTELAPEKALAPEYVAAHVTLPPAAQPLDVREPIEPTAPSPTVAGEPADVKPALSEVQARLLNSGRQLSWCLEEYTASPSKGKANTIMCISIAILVDTYGCGRSWDSRVANEVRPPIDDSGPWTFVYNNRVYEVSSHRFPEYGEYMKLLLADGPSTADGDHGGWLNSSLETRIFELAKEAQGIVSDLDMKGIDRK